MALRSLSVQSKLLLAFTLLTLLGIALVSYTAYTTARASLLTSIERQLVGLQRSKASMVRGLLTSTKNEVLTMSGGDDVSAIARELTVAYRQLAQEKVTPEMREAVRAFYPREFEPALASHTRLEPKPDAFLPTTETGWYLHYHYMVNGGHPYGSRRRLESSTDKSAFAAVLARARHVLGPSLDSAGLENVVLVDPETLAVIFSYDQSTIFGTMLESGPYSASGVAMLARALRRTQDEDDYKFADFEPFRPALGMPKAFIASPVFDGPKLVSIMILRFPIEPISQALSNNGAWEADGLGKTGQVYLVGPDMTMRVDSRFLVEDKAKFLETSVASRLTARTIDEVRRLGTTILDGADRDRRHARGLQWRQRLHRDHRLPRRGRLHRLRAGRSRLLALGPARQDRSQGSAGAAARPWTTDPGGGCGVVAAGLVARTRPRLDHHPSDRGTGAGGTRGQRRQSSRRASRSTLTTSSARSVKPSTRWSTTWARAVRRSMPRCRPTSASS